MARSVISKVETLICPQLARSFRSTSMVINPTMSSMKTDTSLQGKLYLCENDVRVSSRQFKRNPYQEAGK